MNAYFEKPQQVEEAKAYREVMKRFERMDWFGVGIVKPETQKHVPVHVNGRNNPLPAVLRDRKSGKPIKGVPMKLTPGHDRDHLAGVTPTFHVTRGDRRVGLYGMDIDGSLPGDWQPAAKYAQDILKVALPGVAVFVEPGRSFPRKQGAYAWFLIDWCKTRPPERRLLEKRLNTLLRRIAATLAPPPGCNFDALKGLTTYVETNPYYDPAVANELSWEEQEVVEICRDNWLPKYRAKQVLIARAKDAGQSLTGAQALALVNELPSRYEPMTVGANYQRDKMFYKIDGRPFRHRPELEQERRHYGVLVTRPCWGAHSGERDNNVRAFIGWAESGVGKTTVARLREALEDSEPHTSDNTGQVAEALPQVAPGKATSLCEESVCSHMPDQVADAANQDPTGADNHAVMCSFVREEMRRHGRHGKPDKAKVIAAAVHKYETVGPATGNSHAEHEDRRQRAGRIFDHYALTFDSRKAGGSRGLWIDDNRIADCAKCLSGRISNSVMGWGAKGHKPPTREQVTVVYLVIMRGIVTGRDRGVSYKSIRGLLSVLGRSMTNQRIGWCISILVQAGQLERTRLHYSCPNGGCGRPTQYRLGRCSYIPDWADPHLPAQARGDSHAHETPRVGIAKPSAATPLAPPALENSIKELPVCDIKGEQRGTTCFTDDFRSSGDIFPKSLNLYASRTTGKVRAHLIGGALNCERAFTPPWLWP